MRVRDVLLAAVAGLALSSGVAKADTYTGAGDLVGTLNVVSPGGVDAYVTGPGHSNAQVWAGQIDWNYASSPSGWMPQYTGKSTDTFGTYCTQLNVEVNFTEKVKFVAYNLELLPDLVDNAAGHETYAHSRALAIEALFGMALDRNSSSTKAEAFQTAIWEIIYDAPGSWNIGTGTFRVTNSGSSAAVYSQAVTYLGLITTGGALNDVKDLDLATVTGLKAYDYNNNQAVQNQSILAAAPSLSFVPLPASATAGFALLVLNGLWYWKRRRD